MPRSPAEIQAEQAGPEVQAEQAGPEVQQGQPEPGMLRGIIPGAFAALAVLVIAVAALAFVVPRFISAVPLAVLTGSMEPAYSPGDLVIARAVPPEDIRVGDVVTFQPEAGDPMLITHRVIAKSLGAGGVASFTTQGDANGAADEPIVPEQMKGKVIYSLPYLGYVTTALGPELKAALAAVIGVGLLGYAVFSVFGGTRGKGRKTKESSTRRDPADGSGTS